MSNQRDAKNRHIERNRLQFRSANLEFQSEERMKELLERDDVERMKELLERDDVERMKELLERDDVESHQTLICWCWLKIQILKM